MARDADDDPLRPPEPRPRDVQADAEARARGLRPLRGDASRRGRPQPLGRVLDEVLSRSGLGARVVQSQAVADWASVVGPGIARVSEALWVTGEGVLVVRVATAAWRAELSLLGPELLGRLNAVPGRAPLTGLRFVHGAAGAWR
ncbi:MAG: DUF721 domain-containing protein [Gemmatimonadaceae bacterium]|jgi:predicted nucleic acid-binding Zn ribbon protein|nr:DUF721 domain-containing protein [Gemmatimonadaceae bacterium]